MRIIAGKYRSRVLKSSRGMKLRPTSDRLRETLFNILGPQTAGARFVDLYAGTGAVGIEALSRGAAHAVFVEKHAPAAALIRQNLDALGVTTGATVLAVDALRGIEMLAARHAADPAWAADIVFLDPPWAEEAEYARVLALLGAANFLAPDARVVVEHRNKLALPERFGKLRRTRLLEQGDAALSFYQMEALSV
ncbi:MAG: 16S rRNA (guanine(966)-N(2))-methyltransferase RsmD [Acidobacteriia bacterium]|nr:16S rRNA (guanine(966)-N(2))-methyltransferase RsmD [Terriglobia bacterium]MBZ5703636.1 16S rRNA (guanine(966)-N(2))-methyltransferase RsmD [Terriglobia bacterium]